MERESTKGDQEMQAVIITAIICVTMVLISWINKDKPRRRK